MEKKNKKNPLKVVSLEKKRNEGSIKLLVDALKMAEEGELTSVMVLGLSPTKQIASFLSDGALYVDDEIFIGYLEKLKFQLLFSNVTAQMEEIEPIPDPTG